MLVVCCMGVACAHYNVKHYGKHEILLIDTYLLYIYFPPDWVGQYLGTYQNNITHVSSAVSHDIYN